MVEPIAGLSEMFKKDADAEVLVSRNPTEGRCIQVAMPAASATYD